MAALLWYRNDLLRFRFLFRSGSGSGFGSRARQTILITVSRNKKNCTKSCLFNVRSCLSPRKLAFHFRFFDFFYYILCWIRIHIWFRIRNCNAFFNAFGSLKAKSYSSCGSGSGSTLNSRQETKAPLKDYGGIGPWIWLNMYYFSMDCSFVVVLVSM